MTADDAVEAAVRYLGVLADAVLHVEQGRDADALEDLKMFGVLEKDRPLITALRAASEDAARRRRSRSGFARPRRLVSLRQCAAGLA